MKSFKTYYIYLIIMSVFVIIAACGSGGGGSSGGGGGTSPAATLTSIAISPANPNITIGNSQQLTATGTYSDSSTGDITSSVTWSSSNTGIAAVNNSGLAASASVGSTKMTAVSGDISGTTALTVRPSVNLARTGQTTCYDATGAVIACAGTGQDGDLRKGTAWPNPRFTDNGNGTVTDDLTGLIWLKNANCFGSKTWTQALTDANALSSGQCGLTDGSQAGDWHLPNRKELRSLINYGQANADSWLNSQGFSNVQNYFYWTSTTSTYDNKEATVVIFGGNISGIVQNNNKGSFSFLVWPVRSGQGVLPKTGQTTCYDTVGAIIACSSTGQDGDIKTGIAWPNPRFTVGTGVEVDCITDNLTGLMWERATNTLETWANALTYADRLSLCGYDDWRLPNINELESLVNAGQAYPPNDWFITQGFTGVQHAGYHWSSTTLASVPIAAWGVAFNDGSVSAQNGKVTSTFVLAVRGVQ